MTTTLNGTEELSSATDTQLRRRLAGARAGEASFIAAAETELRRRGLVPREVARRPRAVPVASPVTVDPPNLPLAWPLRLLIVATAIGLLGTLFAAYYEDQGQKQKAEDCWMALIIGVVGWCVAIFLICLL